MPNLKMIRVQSKLDELFNNKIDLADASDDEERKNKYYTRAIAEPSNSGVSAYTEPIVPVV